MRDGYVYTTDYVIERADGNSLASSWTNGGGTQQITTVFTQVLIELHSYP